jgi:hypothetical protein
LKTYLWSTSKDVAPTQSDQDRRDVRRRQTLTLIFALVLISIAGVSSAQSPQSEQVLYTDVTLQYDGTTPVQVADPEAVVANQVVGGAVPGNRLRGDARPAYVELFVALANFDADASPDGWRAEVVLRDRKDRPVAMRANATFELMPRVSTGDHLRFVDANMPPVRWSMPLEFDEDSIARVKLPLRQSLHQVFGWPSALIPDASTRRQADRSFRRQPNRTLHRGLSGTFVTSDTRYLIGAPSVGELRVRLSVPTEGVFKAATPVQIRPSVLVDTQWPYR